MSEIRYNLSEEQVERIAALIVQACPTLEARKELLYKSFYEGKLNLIGEFEIPETIEEFAHALTHKLFYSIPPTIGLIALTRLLQQIQKRIGYTVLAEIEALLMVISRDEKSDPSEAVKSDGLVNHNIKPLSQEDILSTPITPRPSDRPTRSTEDENRGGASIDDLDHSAEPIISEPEIDFPPEPLTPTMFLESDDRGGGSPDDLDDGIVAPIRPQRPAKPITPITSPVASVEYESSVDDEMDELPDWLSEDRGGAIEIESVDEESDELPDWLSEDRGGAAQPPPPAQSTTPRPAPGVSIEGEEIDALPDWLSDESEVLPDLHAEDSSHHETPPPARAATSAPGASIENESGVDVMADRLPVDIRQQETPREAPSPTLARPIARPAASSAAARFSAYYPPRAPVQQKSGLYVYAHTAAVKDIVENDVKRFTDELGGTVPTPRAANQTVQLAIGTRLKVVPQCDDLELEPQSLIKTLRGDWTRFEFEFIPPANLVNEIILIRVSIRIEEIEIAHIKCAVEVVAAQQSGASDVSTAGLMPVKDPMMLPHTNPLAAAKFAMQSTTPYQHIFVSYSRRDSRVARAFKMVQSALGHDVFLDVDNLRAGENWRAALARAIDQADVFQLFWSEHSASSDYCKYEWDYALTYRAKDKPEGFVRPVYWRKPMPSPPQELADLNFTYCEFEKPNPLTALFKAVSERLSSVYRRLRGQE